MPADKPSAARFVIRPVHADPAVRPPELAGSLGKLDALGSAKGGWEVVLDEPRRSARDAWRVLQKQVGASFLVLPVIEDGEGGSRYPTGDVMVRFKGAATDEQLQALEASMGLALVERSRFTRNQAAFRVRDATRVFAPDLVRALMGRDEVEAAWLDTESRYRRAV